MRPATVAASALLLVGTATGCGSHQPSAADRAPGLSVRLERVDAALAQHRFTEARRDLRALMSEATSAHRSGDLSASSTQRILAAATEVLDALPSGPPTGSTAPTSGASPSSTSSTSSSPTAKPSRSPKPTRSPTSGPTTAAPTTTPPAPTPSPTPTTQQPSPATATQQSNPTGTPTPGPTA